MAIQQKPISLALQGGGSHGAFTWGVLDYLLSDERISLEGVSGTSSGAMNATVVAYGLARGGRDYARTALQQFWNQIGQQFSHIFKSPMDTLLSGFFRSQRQPGLAAYLELTKTFSPYQLNPLDMNPLRGLVEESIDFEFLKENLTIKLFISATHVKTGKLRVFENHEISIDALMASACLPSIHKAVEIEGESYWDGGFSGNPPVFPLIFNCQTNDITVVMLHPLEIEDIPVSADDIQSRTSELSFNSAFLREMRAIAFSKELVDKNWISTGRLESRMKKTKIHLIQDQRLRFLYDPKSRYNTLPAFIEKLHDEGFACAQVWMENHYDLLGKRSSIDLNDLFC